MAKDLTPDAWLASWSEDGTNITLPIASVTGLVASEADATTGDIRVVMSKLLAKLMAVRTALPDADKPATFTISKSITSRSVEYQVRITGAQGDFVPGTEP